MLGGGPLYLTLVALAVWLAILCQTAWKLLRRYRADRNRTFRTRLTIVGIGLAAVAVASLLLLHLSWTSPILSQRLGSTAISILSLILVFATLLGFVLSAVGNGKIRILGVGTTLITGLWWLGLATTAGFSGTPLARHPTRFLIPEGYVGWVEVKYADANSPALPQNAGVLICRIPEAGLLSTSSQLGRGWAKDEYFYYAADGSVSGLKETGWGQGGVIWGNVNSATEEYFYVGTEGQYHHSAGKSAHHP
jgi:hypothetical protein